MTRYAPGYTGQMLPAAPTRPGTKSTVTGAPATPMTGGPKTGLAIGPQNINPVRPGIAGTRPPGVGGVPGLPGGPKRGMKKGGKVSSASKRADGCAIKGKTKGKMV
jgi:hypothetical protein